MSSFLRKFSRNPLYLKKSQLSLFDWQPSHEEVRARQAHQRHLQSGAVVNVAATQAKVRVRDAEGRRPKHGEKVYYKTPEMNRKKKGFIAGGTHEDGYHIQPVRGGYTYKPEKVTVHRDHIWTHEEHEAELATAPKLTVETSVQRKETAEQKTGYNEGDVLKHPTFVTGMRASLGKLAATNGFNPHYQNINGVLLNDDPEANELYSEYVTAAMGAYRAASAKATPEDIEELHQHLSGVTKESRIIGQMHRTGRTAALRHLITNNNRKMSEDAYDSAMEDDMESGMRSVSAAAAEERASHQTGTDKASIEAGVMEQIKGLDDPVAEYILTAKFGLGNLEHAYKEQDIASALNKRNIPTSDGEPWNADKVKDRMKDALAQLARTRGVQDLRGFLKSLRDLDDLRKSMPTKREMQLAKVTDLMERLLLVKSHIKEYTRQDGSVVQAHDDKRTKHEHIAMHEHDHKEQIHSGAELKHGKELVEHLQTKGWKQKEVSAVRRNESLPVGDKKDMPKPPEVKGSNKENTALVSSQNVINKMHENASNHSDPVAYLKHVTTSRSNPYLKAADDYRTAMLKHFGHDVDHETKDQRFEKDGHAIVLSGKDGDHKVEHAGYEDKDTGTDKINPSKDHMAQAIAKLGGLHAGEAKKQFDLTGKDFPAIKGALKKDGLDPDKMAELLAEHGYIKKDANGKHDYDDFQDKLRRAATGYKVFSLERDQKTFEAEIKKQEQEYIESMDLGDPEQAVGYQDLHEEAKKVYSSVYEEAIAVLGKDATNQLVKMHQDDVPFGVKEYVDAQLRRAIDGAKGSGKQGDDGGTAKQDATGGSGQAASERSTNDADKAAGGTAGGAARDTAGTTPAAKAAGSGSGADADAVTFATLKAAVAKHDPDYRYTDNTKSPDYQDGKRSEEAIVKVAKELYKKDPDKTMQALQGTGIMEHQVKEAPAHAPLDANPQGGTVRIAGHSISQTRLQQAVNQGNPEKIRRAVDAAKRSGETDSDLYRHAASRVISKSVNHVAYIRRTASGKISNVAEKGSPRERHLAANHDEARQYVARMWRHGEEESNILRGLRKQYGMKEAHAAELLNDHKRNKGM